MFGSNAEMAAASAQMRAIAQGIQAALAELDGATGWSGADAERFQREWDDLVCGRLHAAANKLDGISFTDVVEFLGG